MIRVLGVDTSLTSTGLTRAIIHGDKPAIGECLDPLNLELAVLTIKAPPTKVKTRHALARRVRGVLERIDEALEGIDMVSIEGLAYGGTVKGTNAYALPWIWGQVTDLCERRSIPILVVGTSQIKKYATGNGGNATTKEHVLAAAIKRYPEADIEGNDTADSTIACSVGCRYLGYPIERLPAKNLEIMGSLEYNEPR